MHPNQAKQQYLIEDDKVVLQPVPVLPLPRQIGGGRRGQC